MKYSFSILFLLLHAACGTAQGLIIPSGAYVTANSGNIVVRNNWANNGSFTHNAGTVVLSGTTQTLGGSAATTFNNLTISAGSTTTISSAGHTLRNILLSNGTLNAAGNLTLLSTASHTAAVDGSGSGEVLGNLIVQRYIASGFGYKYFSSPFQADTVGDFSDDMNLGASFPTFYRHDENQSSNGWINYTSGAGLLTPMRGYAANLGASAAAATVDLQGVVNNHTVSLNLYNHNMAYTQGFNLVGNPYPSPVDWDAVGGWTKTNIDNAVYYFNAGTTDQYTGVYSSYINGVSSDGTAGNTIAAMQGFFVHVSNGGYPVTGLLSVNNTARVLNAAANFYRVGGQQGNQPMLRLSAGLDEQSSLVDPAVFYFNDAASNRFNRQLDALKLMNTDSLIPNLYAVAADVQKLSIQALPNSTDTLTLVPLGLSTKKDGWVSFKASELATLPGGLHVYLTDKAKGVSHDLRKEPLYRVFLPHGVHEKRFFLAFSKNEMTGDAGVTDNNIKIYSTGGRLFVNAHLANTEKAVLTVVNMLGQVSSRQEITGNLSQQVAGNFAAGMYVVNIESASKKYSKKIFIDNR